MSIASQLEKAVELLVGQSSGASHSGRKRTASSKPTSTKRFQLDHGAGWCPLVLVLQMWW